MISFPIRCRSAVDEDLKAVATGTYDKVEAKMAELRVADALTEIFNLRHQEDRPIYCMEADDIFSDQMQIRRPQFFVLLRVVPVRLYDQGDIYKGAYEGMYCTPCESFWTESQLKDGKCPDCGREVKPAKEEAYFFKMSKYADRLIDHINRHPEFIQPVSRTHRPQTPLASRPLPPP